MKKSLYPKIKVKIRFINNLGRNCTAEQMLKGILPALWDEKDQHEVIASIDDYAKKYNENQVFFYPFPLDLHQTRLLDKYVSGFQHFPWDTLDEDIPHVCINCRGWDFAKNIAPVKPFFQQGQANGFICPNCHNIVVDDWAAEKAGATYWLTKKQLKEKYGIDAPEPTGETG